MPPNATQMTMSMMTMQQQVHPVAGGGQIGTASGAPTSVAAAPINSSTVNSNNSQQVAAAGGQRTALKLSSHMPGPHGQQQRQQQHADVHQWNQQPAPLECSTISGLTTATTTTTTTTTTTATTSNATHNERARFDQQAGQDQLDDPSECSCSDSFECSLNEQSLSTGSHLDKPLLGTLNRYESPAAHHSSSNSNNNHHHHHQHQHQHQQQQQPQLRPHPRPMLHEHHDIYSQHHQFHAHYHGKGRPDFERPHPNYYPAPLQQQQQPSPYYAGNQQQSQPPISATEHQRNQRHHRPLMPHASVPLPLGANGHLGGPCAGAHQSSGSSPAPLVRHSTYATTSETITDDSAPMHPADQRRQAYAHTCEDPTGRVSPPPVSYSHYPTGSISNNSTEIQRRPRREIAFRRSATTREDSSTPNRWRPDDQLQAAHSNYQHDNVDSARTLPRERHHQSGLASRGSSSTLQRQAKSRAAEGQPQATSGSQQRTNAQQQHRSLRHNDRGALQRARTNDPPPAPSDQIDFGGCDGGAISDLGGLADGGCHMAGDSLAALATGCQASALDVGPFGASISAGQLGFSQPFSSAATVDFGTTSGWPPVQRPLGAIPSHRTNSPWMRLSSIILTPVGIVIVLFIVVSPMLHYLM